MPDSPEQRPLLPIICGPTGIGKTALALELAEQYGMEFRRAQRDEWPNEGLIERHRREIFPLLHERWRFSGSAGFRQLTATE